MAAITVTASRVALVYPKDAIVRSRRLNAAVDAGTSLYLMTSGKVDKADANDAGKEQFAGIALSGGGAGQTIDVIEEGEVAGFGVSGLNVGALVYQGDTAGELADAASATKTVVVGKVDVVMDSTGTAQKVLRVSRNRVANF